MKRKGGDMKGDISGEIGIRLEEIRSKKPLIHHITNFVVMNETANATICVGALPVMAHAVQEVEEMVGIADSLVLNIGTLYPEMVEAMIMAGREANRKGIPVILDPVGAGATAYRTNTAKKIMEDVSVSVVRGNAGEVSTLAGRDAEVRGVESMASSSDMSEITKELARNLGCVAAVTGAVDIVSDGEAVLEVHNGHYMMGQVTGTGCIATTVVACFCAVSERHMQAAAEALAYYGLAGETAAGISGDRPGTFHQELYNALKAIGKADMEDRIRIESSKL